MIELESASSIVITTLVDNSIDSLLSNSGPALRQPLMNRDSAPLKVAPLFVKGDVAHELRAEHGLSLLVDVTVGDKSHRLLMDAGRTTDGLASNMECLGIKPSSIDAVILSHGHGDHSGGLNGIIAPLLQDRRTPLFAHPDAFLPTRSPRDSGDYSYPDRLKAKALTDSGFDLMLTPEPTIVMDGVGVSGEVPRKTTFEVTGGGNTQKLKDSEWVSDELLDEQVTIVRTEEGLVLLVGCSHCGLINAVRYAQEITGEERIHAIVGGFHLSGNRVEKAVEPTVDALAQINPDYIVPSHCTGFRASTLIASRLPEAFIANSVGTRFVFA